MITESTTHCVLCGRSELEAPLTIWQYQGQQLHVCPACMPAFIHHTEEALARVGAGLAPAPSQADAKSAPTQTGRG